MDIGSIPSGIVIAFRSSKFRYISEKNWVNSCATESEKSGSSKSPRTNDCSPKSRAKSFIFN